MEDGISSKIDRPIEHFPEERVARSLPFGGKFLEGMPFQGVKISSCVEEHFLNFFENATLRLRLHTTCS